MLAPSAANAPANANANASVTTTNAANANANATPTFTTATTTNRQLHESHRDKIVVIKFYGSHCQAIAPILAPTLS